MRAPETRGGRFHGAVDEMYKRGGAVGEGAKIENSQGYRDWLKANGKNDNASMRRAYANEVVRKLTDLFGKAFRSMGFGGKDGGKRQGLNFSFVDKIEDTKSGGDTRTMAILNLGDKKVAIADGYTGGTDPKSVADYIKSNKGLVATIMETGLPVEIGGDLPKEYANSKYSQRLRSHEAGKWEDKARFTPSLGEMIEIAENRRWERESNKHKHPSHFKYGFYRYDSTVAVPDGNGGFRAYDVELVINNHVNKKHYLYDVVNIKENARLSGLTAAEIQSRSEAKALHSPNSIANSAANVNGESEVAKIPKGWGLGHLRRPRPHPFGVLLAPKQFKTRRPRSEGCFGF